MTMPILYIEDSPANTLLMRKIIRRMPQYELYDVPNAEEGLDMLKTLKPKVILMDIGLPGMNGFQALKEIRQQFDLEKKIPVIAVSADAMPDHVKKGFEADFFDYIIKPIDFSQLITAIELAVGSF
ncbi:MAG: response regulator [Methylomarinum sp.]|nr:response regulator [Methylococcales bacterium]NOR70308.1 response regulator [Methylomarinum sp.]